MSVADEYRAKAALLAAQARRDKNPATRAQLKGLERGYLRLAVQADKNAMTNIVYETPEPRPAVQQQQQQQQAPVKKKPQL